MCFSSKHVDFFPKHRHGFLYQRQLGAPLQFTPFILKDSFALHLRNSYGSLISIQLSKYDMEKLLELRKFLHYFFSAGGKKWLQFTLNSFPPTNTVSFLLSDFLLGFHRIPKYRLKINVLKGQVTLQPMQQ